MTGRGVGEPSRDRRRGCPWPTGSPRCQGRTAPREGARRSGPTGRGRGRRGLHDGAGAADEDPREHRQNGDPPQHPPPDSRFLRRFPPSPRLHGEGVVLGAVVPGRDHTSVREDPVPPGRSPPRTGPVHRSVEGVVLHGVIADQHAPATGRDHVVRGARPRHASPAVRAHPAVVPPRRQPPPSRSGRASSLPETSRTTRRTVCRRRDTPRPAPEGPATVLTSGDAEPSSPERVMRLIRTSDASHQDEWRVSAERVARRPSPGRPNGCRSDARRRRRCPGTRCRASSRRRR